MARIRITLEDDDGREINGDKERLYDLAGGAQRLVDIEAAVESFKQAVLPELTAELLTLAQHQFVAEVKKRGVLRCNGTRRVGSVAKFDFWAKSKNMVSGIQ
jgi:hypothetical protein